jgi:hypothetical protein
LLIRQAYAPIAAGSPANVVPQLRCISYEFVRELGEKHSDEKSASRYKGIGIGTLPGSGA